MHLCHVTATHQVFRGLQKHFNISCAVIVEFIIKTTWLAGDILEYCQTGNGDRALNTNDMCRTENDLFVFIISVFDVFSSR